ncbi:MAG TPA: hypothetical protein VKB16_08385 [Beijerinckiaceae bacterium]|nr:hypothetical protein [Beijerinckiaceae bacterium]
MTLDPATNPSPQARPPSLARRVLTLPLVVLATLLVLVDDLFRSIVKPAAAWLAGLKPFRRLEALIASLPPYPTLALFLIPMAVIWPIKLYALYLIGLGHVGQGTAAFVVAKVVGVGLAERLFAISRDKLLSIGWFAKAYYAVIRIRDRVHLYLKGTVWWPALVAFLARARNGWRRLRATTGALLRRLAPRSLVAAVRRLIESRRPSAS